MTASVSPNATRIIFFGNERLATGVSTEAPTLQRLLNAGYDVVAVVSHDSGTKSRTHRELEIAEVAQAYNIPVFLPGKPAEILDQIREFKADIGVLVAYGKIVPQSIIDIFPHGIINIHPSLLPLHRGPIPIESVILDGSTSTGVSVMALAREMDAGPIYGQDELSLGGTESKQALATRLLNAGGEILLDLLPQILTGSLEATPQNHEDATYDALIIKSDGVMDFTQAAVQLERKVRAYVGWPGSHTRIGDTEVIITATHVLPELDGDVNATKSATARPGDVWRSGKKFGFVTASGVLVVDRLKPVGKQDMDAVSFLAGYSVQNHDQ